MDHKIATTLQYLVSLLNIEDDTEIRMSLKKDKVFMIHVSDLSEVISIDIRDSTNPIKRMIEHINDYMCTDCVEVDYLYRNDFFVALMKGYIESLVHEFGTHIAIPFALARAIIKFDLCSYTVQFQSTTLDKHWVTLTKNDTSSDNWDVVKNKNFRLVCN